MTSNSVPTATTSHLISNTPGALLPACNAGSSDAVKEILGPGGQGEGNRQPESDGDREVGIPQGRGNGQHERQALHGGLPLRRTAGRDGETPSRQDQPVAGYDGLSEYRMATGIQ